MKNLPLYSVDLVKELDKEFPHRCPDKRDSERDIWIKTGKRELIDYLLILMERAEKNALSDTLKGENS